MQDVNARLKELDARLDAEYGPDEKIDWDNDSPDEQRRKISVGICRLRSAVQTITQATIDCWTDPREKEPHDRPVHPQ